ncbi:MAG: hypothetical protein JHC95_09920 [Solirubrobacteraceae bacterium]|nr:hypothetical protein [Solirubrobacteraceae bacterium]
MAPIYRAYGQIRRGSGPWRRPFLIPSSTPAAPLLPGEGYIAVDNGGANADLRCQLRVLNFTSLDDFRVGFQITKIRSVSDITLRLLLLKSADDFFVDSGTIETNVSFAVLYHRTLPGQQFPGDLKINVDTGRPQIDPKIDDINTPITVASGMRATTIKISVESGLSDDLTMGGGLVDGDMIPILGVRTTNDTVTGGYREHDDQIRGIDLDWLDNAAAPKPPSATWIDLVAANPTSDTTKLDVTINMPETGETPTAAPKVSPVPGGQLRAGYYRYRLVYVTENGNETAAGPRSAPQFIQATNWADPATPRSIKVDSFPPLPPDADTTGPRKITKLRIYRTDPDVPAPDETYTLDDVGNSGDDVFVKELALTETSWIDTGQEQLASGKPDVIKPDLILLEYSSPHDPPLDLTGGIRLIGRDPIKPSEVTDESYTGAVSAVPNKLRVAYQPSTEPRLRWSASKPVPRLSVNLAPLVTPLGTGVDITAESVPDRLSIDWSSLGSEYFQLAARASTRTDPTMIGDRQIGRVAARLGTTSPAPGWPNGEAHVAVDMTTELAKAGTAASTLASALAVKRIVVTSGARKWADRESNRGRIGIEGLFAPGRGFTDRDLRVTRRSGGTDVLQQLNLTARLLPEQISGEFFVPDSGAIQLNLDQRIRWIRGEFETRSKPEEEGEPPTEISHVKGQVLLDHTTDKLRFASQDSVHTELTAPIRAGGRVDLTEDHQDPADKIVLRPDAVVPATTPQDPALIVVGLAKGSKTIRAIAAEPGIAARVAASFGDDLPVAVRANPQVKAVQHGDKETTQGLRAVSARLQGVIEAQASTKLTKIGKKHPAPGEVPVTVAFSGQRTNSSLRGEAQIREKRVAHDPDSRATAGLRSWLRARTAFVPTRVSATPAFVAAGAPLGSTFGGIALDADVPWGFGTVWAEPGFAWEEFTDVLGEDKGIGLITAGFDGLPSQLETWLLEHSGDLGPSRVPTEIRLPETGPVDTSWPPGGVLAWLNGALKLSYVRVELPGASQRHCREDGDDRPVRHGAWTGVQAPFIRAEPTAGGRVRMLIWTTGDAISVPPPDPDPCEVDVGESDRKSAIGWHIDENLRISMAVRISNLYTPSGKVVPRWWAMPTSVEEWDSAYPDDSDDENPRCGKWFLLQELQMKDYRGLVAFYPKEALDNPFGDWEAGPGQWWLRARGGLHDFIGAVPGLPGSGDAYMGNVGGGFHFGLSNGIYSTLPRIWTW